MSVFPQRLHHTLPSWVQSGAVFHIRVRAAESTPCLLTDPTLADRLLESVRFYTERESWHHHLCLLMPDHNRPWVLQANEVNFRASGRSKAASYG